MVGASSPASASTPSRRQVLSQVLRLVWNAAPTELGLVICLEVIAASFVAAQLLLARQVLVAGLDGGGAAEALEGVVPELLLVVAITGVNGLVAAAINGRRAIVGQLVEREALEKVVHRAATARLEEFDDPDFHDQLQRAKEAAEFRPWQVASGIIGGLTALATSFGILAAVMIVEPWLALLAVLAYVPLGLATRRDSSNLLRVSLEYTDEERERHHILEVLTERRSAGEVRNLGWAGPFTVRHDSLYQMHMERQRWLFRQQLRRSLIANTVSSGVIALAIGMIAYLAGSGRDLSLADAGVAAVAIAQLGTRFRGLSASGASLYEATLFLTDYFEFISHAAAEEASQESVAARSVDSFSYLVLSDVGFTYPQAAAPTLRDISLEIRPGELIALVGPSGSGKTTLSKVLAGLYEPSEGRIEWDGVDQMQLSSAERAANASVVFQDFSKLEMSARMNISASADARDDDTAALTSAADASGILSTIERLPAGFATRLSPSYTDGVDLSEGEWQRIAIARSLFRPRPLLILDEPTASLDARSERRLLDVLRDRFADRAIILVTHRIANACLAERVLVMDGGMVVEDGAPRDLASRGSIFAEFAELQGVTAVFDSHN